jgi:ribosomal protein S14
MRSVVCSDSFRRGIVQKNQVVRKLLSLQGYLDSFVFININVFSYRCYWTLNGYGSFVKVRKRCFISGRGRGISIFGLSRHTLRSLMKIGFMSGLVRATW